MNPTRNIRAGNNNNNTNVDSFSLDSCESALAHTIKKQQDADKFRGVVQMAQFEVLYQQSALADTVLTMHRARVMVDHLSGHLVDSLVPVKEKPVNPKAYGVSQNCKRGEFNLQAILAQLEVRNTSNLNDFVDGTVEMDDLAHYTPEIIDSKTAYNHRIISRIKRWLRNG
jgi:hypothetical protein